MPSFDPYSFDGRSWYSGPTVNKNMQGFVEMYNWKPIVEDIPGSSKNMVKNILVASLVLAEKQRKQLKPLIQLHKSHNTS